MSRATRVASRRRRLQGMVAVLAVGGLMAATLAAIAAAPPEPFLNGFEAATDVADDASYASNDVVFYVSRIASGTNGVVSADGAWHAEAPSSAAAAGAVFTRYGGYGSAFPTDGYITSIDIYLDTADSPIGADLRLDWSSAISTPAATPLHRRDFIFSVGTNGAGGFVMSVSNNAPGWPANPNRDPYTIETTGWYTFQHHFYDAGTGVLAVDMSVLDSTGTVLQTWTLSDPTDIIGSTVGGNRYGWLVNNAFDGLAIDNVYRSGVLPMPETKNDCKKGGWEDLYRADGSTFKNQGDCIQYVNTGK